MKKNLLKSFGITITIILITFLLLGIFPFGNRSMVIIDSNTQYVTFLTYLRTILLGQNNFKYTFSSTLGQNMIPLIGYYLMSIFNILVIFFKPENMKILITILMILKIGLCSTTMEYYLSKKYHKNTLLFSICYGLMTYNIVYMYHIMWFDSIILFPLVILGIDKIFSNKSPLLYIISLSLAIIFNYYIGTIICITSVLYFIYKYIFTHNKINKFKVITEYLLTSLLSGMISAFILLPSLLGLMNGKLMNNPVKFGFNTTYTNIIAKAFTASVGVNETWHGGPMIGASMLIFILVILYFFNKKITKKEKIINAISLFILATTFTFKPLCLLFHGLTEPNCFNYRHAFIFVFFTITLAIRSYNKNEYSKKTYQNVKYILIILSIIILLSNFKFNQTTYNISIIISIILGLLYIYKLQNKKTIIYLLLIDLFINTFANVTMLKLSDKQYMNEYKNYVKNTNEAVEAIKDDTFYRIEKTFDRETNKKMLAINDSMIFNYNGISHFDSTSSLDIENLFEQLGQRKLLTRVYYNNSTYLLDSLFGLKYILSNTEYKNYDLIKEVNNIKIYENPYYLSLGYSIKNKNIELSNNPFINQNNIIKAFTGLNEDIFKEAKYKVEYENVEIENNIYKTKTIGKINYYIKSDNKNLYLYIPVNENIKTNYPNIKVYVNDKYITDYLTKYEWSTLNLGKNVTKVTLEFENEMIMNDIYFYYENIDIFEKHYNLLKNNQVNINKITSSNLKGDISIEEASIVLFTIPYDEGWNIKVDGKEIKYFKVMDSLIGLDLEKGSHKINLNYEPKGLKLGIYISLISLIITIIYVILRKKIWSIYDKFKELFNYIIVGALTTLVSLVSYFIFSRIMNIEKTIYFILANTLSWILSVAFAYITNKIFVFASKTKNKEAIKEAIKFVSSRILTYLIDLALMFIFVKLIKINNDTSKLIVQFVVLVLNYILSKLLVFKKEK